MIHVVLLLCFYCILYAWTSLTNTHHADITSCISRACVHQQNISCTLTFTDKNVTNTNFIVSIPDAFRTHFGCNNLTIKVIWCWPKWSSIGLLVKPCIFKLNVTIDTSYCKTKWYHIILIETNSCFGPNPAIIQAPSWLIPKFWWSRWIPGWSRSHWV